MLNATQFLIVITPIGPVALFANKSHPSSELLYDIHPSNTLPSPHVSFAANPSAFSPVPPWSGKSQLSCDVQLIIRLFDGHKSLVAAVVSYLEIWSHESLFASNTHFSKMLLLPASNTPLSPAP